MNIDARYFKLNNLQIIITASFVAAFILIITFVVIPGWHDLEGLRNDIRKTKKEIRDINILVGGSDKIGDALEKYEKHLNALELKLPKNGADTLRMLRGEAKKSGLDVLSIREQPPENVSTPTSIDGYSMRVIPVYIHLRGHYRQFGDYLDKIRSNYYSLFVVVSAEMRKMSEDDSLLDVELYGSAYIAIR